MCRICATTARCTYPACETIYATDFYILCLHADVHLLDIVSTRMLGNFGFLSKVFNIFKEEEISVDVVATSEISVSVTLDSSKLWSRELIGDELDHLAARFAGNATVDVRKGLSIISLICDASRSSQILKQVCCSTRHHTLRVRLSGLSLREVVASKTLLHV